MGRPGWMARGCLVFLCLFPAVLANSKELSSSVVSASSGTNAECNPPSTCQSSVQKENDRSPSHQIVVNLNDDGKEIHLTIGDIIRVELEQAAGTGYEWQIEETYKDHFEIVSVETAETLRQGFTGTPVIKKWHLKSVNRGATELVWILFRTWEGKGKSAKQFKIRVRII